MTANPLLAVPSVSQLMKALHVQARKELGQNFLLDSNITSMLSWVTGLRSDKFVKAAGNVENTHVFEIGPGPGCLTRSILRV